VLVSVSEINEKVLPAITLKRKDEPHTPTSTSELVPFDGGESPGESAVSSPVNADGSEGPALPCPAFQNRRRFSRQRGSISLDESVLTTPRLNAPAIHIILDQTLPGLPSSGNRGYSLEDSDSGIRCALFQYVSALLFSFPPKDRWEFRAVSQTRWICFPRYSDNFHKNLKPFSALSRRELQSISKQKSNNNKGTQKTW